MEKAEDKEGIATVDASKVKEENLKVAGGKCWRGFWLSALKVTGEIFNHSPMKVVIVTIKAENMLKEIFLRELDLALRRTSYYCVLCTPRHCLLQQRCLISLLSCLFSAIFNKRHLWRPSIKKAADTCRTGGSTPFLTYWGCFSS